MAGVYLGPHSPLRVFSRLVEAVAGVGYAILALSMDGEAGQPAKPVPDDDLPAPTNEAVQLAALLEGRRPSVALWVIALPAVLAIGVFIVVMAL